MSPTLWGLLRFALLEADDGLIWFRMRPFKKRRNPSPLTDPVFGPIVFEQGFWKGRAAESNVMLLILAESEAKPTKIQQDFYLKVKDEFDGICERTLDFIRAQADAQDSTKDLTIYAVEIGTDDECRSGRFVVEMADADEILIHRVVFEGNDPIEYGCDD